MDSLVDKGINHLFKWLYTRGETPLSIRTKIMGEQNFLVDDYNKWWVQAQATGIMPTWRGS
ncbi:hypothetical protein JG687_00017853 [Phytophthora cactorum]|nr:hypothetical protein JG687_00017853 [Phytophthora cactorum]